MDDKPVLVHIDNVSFAYNHEKVLEGITMDIHKGEFLGLIGPNGSGKTTLLKIIIGALSASSGTVSLFGLDIHKFHDWQKIGYVPQKAGSTQLQFPVTVEEIVGLGLVGRNAHKNSIHEALESVDMQKFRKRLINELSGGQQQRVFIARALVSKPELLILDEPTAGVDVESQAQFYELLQKLNKDMGITMIMVSHDIDVVTNIVTTMACLNKTLICHLPPKDFIKKDYLEEIYGKDVHYVVHGH